MILFNTITKKLSLLTVGILVGTVLFAQAVTVSPARAELTGDPGETITGTMLLINEQDTDQTFYTSTKNFESQGETGTPNFTTSKEGLPSWVKIVESVTLKKGERVSVPYSIEIPKDAYSGGHFAAIFVSTVPPSTQDGQVSVGAEVGMLVLLKVTGAVKENGGIISFLIKENRKVLTSLPIDFVYRFKNDGNDRVKPVGDIVVKNMFGMESGRINANKSEGNILPNSIRSFSATYGENKAPVVSDPFFDHVKFQMSNFALGVYFANVDVTFGNNSKSSSSLTYFVFPWQLLTVIGVTLLIVILVLTAAIKHYNRWIIKQARAAAK